MKLCSTPAWILARSLGVQPCLPAAPRIFNAWISRSSVAESVYLRFYCACSILCWPWYPCCRDGDDGGEWFRLPPDG